MDIEEWALVNAGAVVRDVERHHLERGARAAPQDRRVAAVTMYVDDGEALRRLDPVVETPARKRPGFAQEVACELVHAAGKPFFPRDPETSHRPVVVPYFVAAELAALLLNLTSDVASN